jgi:AcrR family transcriptional regulator
VSPPPALRGAGLLGSAADATSLSKGSDLPRSSARSNAAASKAAVAAKAAKRPRREQQRAVETRQAILSAALSEFAERGYEAASIRNIGLRTGLQHPLITYHFRSKEILWQAVAENAFGEIRKLWDETTEDESQVTGLEYVREKYFAFLRFTIEHPDFHHFMVRESRPGNPRLPWLVQTILLPTLETLLPQIRVAQAAGDLPPGDPVMVHYMLIGMTSVLSSLKDEIRQTAGIQTDDAVVVGDYMALLDAAIFRPRSSLAPATRKAAARRAK